VSSSPSVVKASVLGDTLTSCLFHEVVDDSVIVLLDSKLEVIKESVVVSWFVFKVNLSVNLLLVVEDLRSC